MFTNITVDFDYFTTILLECIEKYKDVLMMSNDEKTRYLQEKSRELGCEFYNKTSFCEICKIQCVNIALYKGSTEDYSKNLKMLKDKERKREIFNSKIFSTFAKHLKLKYKIDKTVPEYACRISQRLTEYLGGSLYYENKSEILQELFYNAMLLYLTQDSILKFRDVETQELIIAAKRFRGMKNVKFSISNANIELDENSHIIIHKQLESQIAMIGGIEFLRLLFTQELTKKYIKTIDRYLIQRDKSSSLGNEINIRIPYNYLIQISVKVLECKTILYTKKGQEDMYERIIQLGKDYLTVLNLQGYYSYEDIYVGEDLPSIIDKNIYFDKLFTPIQYNPKFVLKMIRNFGDGMVDKWNKSYSFETFFNFCKTILVEKQHCRIFTVKELKQKTKIKHTELNRILEDFSIDGSSVNVEFNSILDTTNYKDKPLINLGDGRYFFLSAHFNGISFYEVLYWMMDSSNRDFRRKKGEQIEKLIKTIFDEKKYMYHCGEYFVSQSEQNECDLVLENDKYIVFFEIKGRPLAKEFEVGNDVKTLKSVSEGMIAAQTQCFKHKLNLKKYGKIELKDNKTTYSLELRGRTVLSVSVCLHEYFFLTNNIFVSTLLESILNTKYYAVDSNDKRDMDKFNDMTIKLKEVVEKYYDNNVDLTRKVFSQSLFRSANQIYTIVMLSENLDNFIELMRKSTYIYDGSGEVYSLLLYECKK